MLIAILVAFWLPYSIQMDLQKPCTCSYSETVYVYDERFLQS